MKKEKKYRVRVREFLNKDNNDLDSNIIAYIQDTSEREFGYKKVAEDIVKDKRTFPYYREIPESTPTFKLSDCYKTITINFTLNDDEEEDNGTFYDESGISVKDVEYKFDLIINTLIALKKATFEEHELYKKRKKLVADEVERLKKLEKKK